MKKPLLLACALLPGTLALAQIAPGTISAGGALGFSRQEDFNQGNDLTDKVTTVRFSPQAAYFIADNLSIGLMLGLERRTQERERNKLDEEITSTSTTIAPFGRYHVSLSEQAYFFGQLALGVGAGKTKFEQEITSGSTVVTEFENRQVFLNLAPGFIYFFTPKLGAELTVGSIGFQSDSSKGPGEDDFEKDNSRTDFGIDLTRATLGVQWYFNR